MEIASSEQLVIILESMKNIIWIFENYYMNYYQKIKINI